MLLLYMDGHIVHAVSLSFLFGYLKEMSHLGGVLNEADSREGVHN